MSFTIWNWCGIRWWSSRGWPRPKIETIIKILTVVRTYAFPTIIFYWNRLTIYRNISCLCCKICRIDRYSSSNRIHSTTQSRGKRREFSRNLISLRISARYLSPYASTTCSTLSRSTIILRSIITEFSSIFDTITTGWCIGCTSTGAMTRSTIKRRTIITLFRSFSSTITANCDSSSSCICPDCSR